MQYRKRINYTEADKALMWGRWQKGESLNPIARLFDRHHPSIQRILAETGGIRPAARRRSHLALSLSEREEISPGREAIDSDSARAVVRFGPFEQAVDITIDKTGAPTNVQIQRWSNANADKVYHEQPFGGELSEFRQIDGYRLPTRVEGGNHFGTPDYFPFFRAEITDIRFPTVASTPSG